MKKQTLDELKTKIIPLLKEAGVTRAAIFGSMARGEQTDKSDVDLLVDLPRGMSFFDVIDLEDKLAAAAKRKVDLVDYEAIKPRLKPYIMRDQIQII